MKKLLIRAYTEFNLGDDLFIKVLCERYPDTRFILIAPGEYKLVFGDLPNLKIYAADALWFRGVNFVFKRLKLHKQFMQQLIGNLCGGTVHIGGSIFMQGEHWREYTAEMEDLRNKSKPYYVLGANFGPYTDEAYYDTYRRLFAEYTDICFREQASYELFQTLGNVRLAPDIIFQMKVSPVQQPEAARKTAAISVIRPSSKALAGFDDLYYEKMKEIAVYFIRRGYAVQLLSFCRHEGDEEAAEAIKTLVPADLQREIGIVRYRTRMEEMLTALAAADCVVASRFHAMILGWVLGKPVYPVAYSKKMVNVMNDAGFRGGYTDFSRLAALQPEEVYRAMAAEPLDVSALARQAENHFARLDDDLSVQPLPEGRRSYES